MPARLHRLTALFCTAAVSIAACEAEHGDHPADAAALGPSDSTGDTTASDVAPADGTAADTASPPDSSPGTDATSVDVGPDVPAQPPGTATFTARGTVRQVYVTHAEPEQPLELRDETGKVLAQGKADHLGSLVFRKVPPNAPPPAGKGYRVYATDKQPNPYSDAVYVLDAIASQPSQAFYAGQKIQPGTGYLTMRDGTTLAYFATLPGKPEDGPYPTIVNYSGYDPARPGKSMVSGEQESYCELVPVLCNAPSDPSALLASVAGYATVSVNVRGTGCSGGAYDYFEELQLLDGYDVVEIVGAQPWVLHHKVGMTGLSYPGITQLFVARTKPPSLAAITPLSVIGNTATTLVPGGILNSGFALNWISHVFKKAAPYGQGWEKGQVDKGDTICKENQLLHDQRVNNVDQAKDTKYYVPEVMTPLNPSAWAGEIEVPVFLAGSWQDEQTGPFFITLLNQLKNSKNRRFLVYNGVHSDGFAPQVLAEWKAFLDLHVAKKVPSLPPFFGILAPEFTKTVFGVALQLPPDRWTKYKTHAEALAAWEKEAELQVILENGAKEPYGAPQGQWKLDLASWPPPQTEAKRWYFQADGTLLAAAPTETAAASLFQLDPEAGERGLGVQGGLWSALPKYTWKQPDPGFEVAFVSPPLGEDLVMVGTGSVDLWIRTTATEVTDADLEVNLSEVRPDGQERYVQSGWLRASFRKLATTATVLFPEPTMIYADSTPLPAKEWTQVRVAIAGFGHVFRKGSRVRIAVDTPGDSRVDWRFDLLKWPQPVKYEVAHSAAHPSSVALPVLAGVTVPATAPLPPCPSLRGQQCRSYVAVPNVAAKP